MKNQFEVRGQTTAIFIYRKGQTVEALIDTDDLEKASAFINTWGLNGQSYVQGRVQVNKKWTYYLLHRLLLGLPDGDVDHINHDRLDNRKTNLRVLTKQENVCNASGARSDNKTSGHLGVSWNKRQSRWVVQVRVKGKVSFYRTLDSDKLEEAKRIADQARAYHMPTSKQARENTKPSEDELLVSPESPRSSNKTSGHRNVHWNEESRKWVVQFNINKKQTSFGRFKELQDAINKAREIRESLTKSS